MTAVTVTDTHSFLRYFYRDSRLSSSVRSFIDTQRRNGHDVGVSAITLIEILYLSEEGRILADAFNDVIAFLERSDAAFVEIAVDQSIARSIERISRNDVPDMPDRIIAATALHPGVALISRDGRIRASNVHTVW